jgi:hypothetical protein
MQPSFFGFPSPAELFDAPERAVLAALDANLVLAVRALKARHPDIGDDNAQQPLPLLAEAVLACALSLHNVLASYDGLARRTARLDYGDEPRDGPAAEDEVDIPF